MCSVHATQWSVESLHWTHPSIVVSRERDRMRAAETPRATPSSVGARVPVILSQQVVGVDSEHWSGGM